VQVVPDDSYWLSRLLHPQLMPRSFGADEAMRPRYSAREVEVGTQEPVRQTTKAAALRRFGLIRDVDAVDALKTARVLVGSNGKFVGRLGSNGCRLSQQWYYLVTIILYRQQSRTILYRQQSRWYTLKGTKDACILTNSFWMW
jgi:hypothetical protein